MVDETSIAENWKNWLIAYGCYSWGWAMQQTYGRRQSRERRLARRAARRSAPFTSDAKEKS